MPAAGSFRSSSDCVLWMLCSRVASALHMRASCAVVSIQRIAASPAEVGRCALLEVRGGATPLAPAVRRASGDIRNSVNGVLPAHDQQQLVGAQIGAASLRATLRFECCWAAAGSSQLLDSVVDGPCSERGVYRPYGELLPSSVRPPGSRSHSPDCSMACSSTSSALSRGARGSARQAHCTDEMTVGHRRNAQEGAARSQAKCSGGCIGEAGATHRAGDLRLGRALVLGHTHSFLLNLLQLPDGRRQVLHHTAAAHAESWHETDAPVRPIDHAACATDSTSLEGSSLLHPGKAVTQAVGQAATPRPGPTCRLICAAARICVTSWSSSSRCSSCVGSRLCTYEMSRSSRCSCDCLTCSMAGERGFASGAQRPGVDIDTVLRCTCHCNLVGSAAVAAT